MAIRKIKASNFKSFDALEVELRPLNVVIGANAAGKSNFLEVFRFLRDLSEHGVKNAVSLQGGMEYLANLKIGGERPVSLEIELASPDRQWKLVLKRAAGSPDFEVVESYLSDQTGRIIDLGGSGIALFDFDPKLPKRAMPITGKADLESDASNLAIVLRNILQDEGLRRRLTLLLRDLLPFVEDLKVDRFADRSLLISLKESFSQESYLPASFLSDGTIHLLTLLLALYFDKAPVVVIEEPERNIHPHLISKVAAMLADASRQKQVIVTTHNPELVKHVRLEDLLLVRRGADGFSRISRPAENEELKVFLENDLGVDELYVQNLLGVGE